MFCQEAMNGTVKYKVAFIWKFTEIYLHPLSVLSKPIAIHSCIETDRADTLYQRFIDWSKLSATKKKVNHRLC